VFLRLAETPRLYTPLFSASILDEVDRTHTKDLNWPQHIAESWRRAVESSFAESIVTGHESLIPICKNNEKDRHVLAAAIKGQAEVIVTFNLKDFPKESLSDFDITAVHPSDYLNTLYSIDAGLVVSRIDALAQKRNRPREVLLATLAKSVPGFSDNVADHLGLTLPP
jgi:predicted nucleic acid-binding protein